MAYSFKGNLVQTQSTVEKRLTFFLERAQIGTPKRLFKAMAHGLLGGGKRLRPFLHLSAARLLKGDQKIALDIALDISCALEMVHCYSLVHDDMPCMDDSPLRRGKPSVQAAFDPATALLAGNALYTLALDILADLDLPETKRLSLIRSLSKASGSSGMMGGQQLDMDAMKSQAPLTLDEITHLQHLKTGALIGVSLECACIAFDAPQDIKDALTLYGNNFGLAFQITDDLLDAQGTSKTLGKPVQMDENKITFVSHLGLEGAQNKATTLVKDACQALEVYDPSKTAPFIQAVHTLLTRVT